MKYEEIKLHFVNQILTLARPSFSFLNTLFRKVHPLVLQCLRLISYFIHLTKIATVTLCYMKFVFK